MDRLTPQETLEIFQLIKANGDLPNIMYLVLFERGAIEKNIEELLKVSGREYVEKIVQVAFDVPTIDRARLKRILFEGLDKALRVDELSERFDKTRWGNLFVGALDPYFETLRQVNRFLSTITFHVSLLRGSGVLEVNAIDLIGLEVLRVFEPDVYRGLPGCKEVLTSVRESNRSGQEQEQRRVLQSLIERTSTERQERVREIIKQLFPPAEWAFGGSRYASGFQERWYRELRVCSPEIFDRYFNFAIPEGDVSQAVIDRLRSLVGDRDGLRQELRSLRDQGLLEVVVDRLEAYKEELPIEQAEPFVTAVFDVGEDLSDDPPGMFEISPAMHALRIIYWFLRREPRPEERARILENAIRNTEGVSLPVRFVSLEEQAANDKDKARDRLLTDEALATLKRLCIEKLSAAAGNGTLAKARELVMILYRWQEWAGRDAPKAFGAELVHTPQGAVLFVEAFLQRSWSHTLGDRVGHERQYINLGVLENFVPWEQVDSALSGLDESSLTEKQRVAVAAFRTAVGRRRAGKPDLGSGRDDEED